MGSVRLRVLVLCVAGVTLSGCAGTAATPTHPPTATWVEQSFHGAGLVVTLDHPVAWRSELQPLSIHYSATFAYLANFPLQQFCTHPSSWSFQCTWADAGTVPTGGIVVTFGVEGYGPGPGIPTELLSEGTTTSIDGRRASEQSGNGPSGCLGVGGDHSTSYFVDDGLSEGLFDMTFCWRGNAPTLAEEVHEVATRLTLRPDPTNAGPFPN